MFFVDLDGAAEDPTVAEAIEALRGKAESVRILGTYPIAANGIPGTLGDWAARASVYNPGAMDTAADPHVGLRGARAPELARVATGGGHGQQRVATGERAAAARRRRRPGAGPERQLRADQRLQHRRATVLVLKERAEILERGEGALHSERLVFQRPCVIRLIRYVRVPRDVHRRKITRKAVLARDAWTCQYCGSQAGGLTVDHVIPRSRGGQSVWENIVASCAPCNRKKAEPHPARGPHAPPQPSAAARARPCSSGSPARGSRSPGSRTWSRPEAAHPTDRSAGPPRRIEAAPAQGAVWKRNGNWRRGGTCSPPPRTRRCPGWIPPGGPHGLPSGPAPPVSRETCDSS